MKLPSAKNYEQYWAQGFLACPECKALNAISDVTPLSFVPCCKCKKQFFAVKKVGPAFLFEPAGGGGMGSVYKAVSEQFPDQLLAVKLLSRKERNSPINVLALLNEARISSVFKESQFIASCLDAGFDNDEYYTVMNFVTGERLDKLIERLGKLPEPNLLKLVQHILAAEQHIYKHGYLFRDLKPENIIVTPEGYAVLLDFGLCVPREQASNQADEYVSGSPYYIPPERLLGQGEDVRSEIYSLGMIMYFALTGRTYFDAEEMNALAKRHLSKLRISNAAKMQDISQPIADLISKMIAQTPDDRPNSFKEIFDTIDSILKSL